MYIYVHVCIYTCTYGGWLGQSVERRGEGLKGIGSEGSGGSGDCLKKALVEVGVGLAPLPNVSSSSYPFP